MKKIILLTTLYFLIITFRTSAQTPPNAFNYSAVARNSSGQPISSTTIGIQINILRNSTTGASQYIENHFVNTDAFGLFNLIIGAGAIQSGSMASINWSSDNYFIRVGMDANGGTNFLTMGTTQLLSVPYALHSKTADSLTGSIIESDPIYNTSIAKNITSNDTNRWNNKQNRILVGEGISKSGDTLKVVKQYQSLSLSNDTIFLTNGGFVKLPNGGHYIGEEFGGGVIFHLWRDAQGIEHGLIVDKTDLSTNQVWSNRSITPIGITARSSWDGLSNSNAIVGQAGHTNSAASLCLNSTNGGQNDWYLPSLDELSLLWHSRFNINKSISTIGGATVLNHFANNFYWCSTESSDGSSWSFMTGNGDGATNSKNNPAFVRAIRRF
jgi:hypothetical protein